MKRYVLSHLPIALVYALVIFLFKSSWWNQPVLHTLGWIGWILGVAVGVLLLFTDRIVYTYSYPGTQMAQQFVWYLKQKKYLTALDLLYDRRLEAERLTFRSSLFMVVWVPLAFFALTSTTGLFGKGVVMGLMLHVLYDSWKLQRVEPRRLHLRMFWLIKREVSDEERLIFLWVMTALFVILSLWIG